MAEIREKYAIESQSQSRVASGGVAVGPGRGAVRFFDDVVGKILAAAAGEITAHRAIGGLRIAAAAVSRGPEVGIANHVAATNDHGQTLRDNARRSQEGWSANDWACDGHCTDGAR